MKDYLTEHKKWLSLFEDRSDDMLAKTLAEPTNQSTSFLSKAKNFIFSNDRAIKIFHMDGNSGERQLEKLGYSLNEINSLRWALYYGIKQQLRKYGELDQAKKTPSTFGGWYFGYESKLRTTPDQEDFTEETKQVILKYLNKFLKDKSASKSEYKMKQRDIINPQQEKIGESNDAMDRLTDDWNDFHGDYPDDEEMQRLLAQADQAYSEKDYGSFIDIMQQARRHAQQLSMSKTEEVEIDEVNIFKKLATGGKLLKPLATALTMANKGEIEYVKNNIEIAVKILSKTSDKSENEIRKAMYTMIANKTKNKQIGQILAKMAGTFEEEVAEMTGYRESEVGEGEQHGNDKQLFMQPFISNFYGGKYYERGIDSMFVLASSPEEASKIAEKHIDAALEHFKNKRYSKGSKTIPALKKDERYIKVGRGAKPTTQQKHPKVLTADGVVKPVDLAELPTNEAHGNSKIYDKCWDGYRKVPGKKRGEKGSCVKEEIDLLVKLADKAKNSDWRVLDVARPATLGPNEDYPTPWSLSVGREGIGSIFARNGNQVISYVTRDEGQEIVDAANSSESANEETMNEMDDGILYVYANGNIEELDTNDRIAMQRFNNQHGFHSDSLDDIPLERGVQKFNANGTLVLVSADPHALAAEVEAMSESSIQEMRKLAGLPESADTETCKACSGKGHKPGAGGMDRECEKCDGTGKVTKEKVDESSVLDSYGDQDTTTVSFNQNKKMGDGHLSITATATSMEELHQLLALAGLDPSVADNYSEPEQEVLPPEPESDCGCDHVDSASPQDMRYSTDQGAIASMIKQKLKDRLY